jgi:hypothetical protein
MDINLYQQVTSDKLANQSSAIGESWQKHLNFQSFSMQAG